MLLDTTVPVDGNKTNDEVFFRVSMYQCQLTLIEWLIITPIPEEFELYNQFTFPCYVDIIVSLV